MTIITPSVLADPNSKASIEQVRALLKQTYKTSKLSRFDFIKKCAAGCNTLDIGAGEHHPGYMFTDSWEHAQISMVSQKCIGLDIQPELVDAANSRGYNFICRDITDSTADLGEYFDFIFMGDVIEHLGDLTAGMQFIRRHLAEDGFALVTTPIPFHYYLKSIANVFVTKLPYVPNLEHTCWITPSNMLEICSRASLHLSEIVWLHPPARWPHKKLIRKVINNFCMHEIFYGEYMFILRPL